MFDLEHEISAWRARFAANLDPDSEIIDELETQLRDSVEGLIRDGVELPNAWHLSVEQLGPQNLLVEQLRSARAGLLPTSWAIRSILVLCGLVLGWVVILLGHEYVSGTFSVLMLFEVLMLNIGQLALFGAGLAGVVVLARSAMRGRTRSRFDDAKVYRLLRNLNLLGLIGFSAALLIGMGALHQVNKPVWIAQKYEMGAVWLWISTLIAQVGSLRAIKRREAHTALAGFSFAAAAMGLLAGGVTAVVPIAWLMLAVLFRECALYRLRNHAAVPGGDVFRALSR